jgi:hypothetical protein
MAIFTGAHDGPFAPNRDEIQQVAFFTLDDLAQGVIELTPGAKNVLAVISKMNL